MRLCIFSIYCNIQASCCNSSEACSSVPYFFFLLLKAHFEGKLQQLCFSNLIGYGIQCSLKQLKHVFLYFHLMDEQYIDIGPTEHSFRVLPTQI